MIENGWLCARAAARRNQNSLRRMRQLLFPIRVHVCVCVCTPQEPRVCICYASSFPRHLLYTLFAMVILSLSLCRAPVVSVLRSSLRGTFLQGAYNALSDFLNIYIVDPILALSLSLPSATTTSRPSIERERDAIWTDVPSATPSLP